MMSVNQQRCDYDYCSGVEPKEIAAERGWVVRMPETDELFLDLDGDDQMERFLALYRWAKDNTPLDELIGDYTPTRSKSGQGWHVVVKLTKELDTMTRIALQVSLGSDPKMGLVNVARVRDMDPNPILFFELYDFGKPKQIEAPTAPAALLAAPVEDAGLWVQ